MRTVGERFQRYDSLIPKSQGCSNPELKLANAFSVIRRAKLTQRTIFGIARWLCFVTCYTPSSNFLEVTDQ